MSEISDMVNEAYARMQKGVEYAAKALEGDSPNIEEAKSALDQLATIVAVSPTANVDKPVDVEGTIEPETPAEPTE